MPMTANDSPERGTNAFLLAIAAGSTVADAAQLAGISEATAHRRLRKPGYREQIQELRSEMMNRAMGKMADGMASAADVLVELLSAENESVRLSAARSLLDLGAKIRDTCEFEDRLRALEQRMQENGAAA